MTSAPAATSSREKLVSPSAATIGIAAGVYFDFEGMSSAEKGTLVGLAAALPITVGLIARTVVARAARLSRVTRIDREL